MDYYKVVFTIEPDTQDYRDLLIASLADIAYESFVETDKNIEAYISKPQYKLEDLKNLHHEPLFIFTYYSELIPDRNWNEVWEKNYFKPLLIANKCLVRAPFHTEYPTADIELVIEPKMAFGTGNHETTSLMVEFLLGTNLIGKRILDMGCGTGILSMVSSKLGATEITAIDIDKWAFESTMENCVLNNCNNVTTLQGDSGLLNKGQFDVILANIHKNILISDMDKYCSVLDLNGLLIMSGFYETDLADITIKAKTVGLKRIKHQSKNKWVAVCYKK